MTDADGDTEIRQLEDDLRNLQRRYAILELSGRRLRIMHYVLLAALAALALVSAVMGHLGPSALATAVLVVAIVVDLASARAYPELRWIDQANWRDFGFYPWTVKRTEAQAVEDMVAERMERLARLKGNYK